MFATFLKHDSPHFSLLKSLDEIPAEKKVTLNQKFTISLETNYAYCFITLFSSTKLYFPPFKNLFPAPPSDALFRGEIIQRTKERGTKKGAPSATAPSPGLSFFSKLGEKAFFFRCTFFCLSFSLDGVCNRDQKRINPPLHSSITSQGAESHVESATDSCHPRLFFFPLLSLAFLSLLLLPFRPPSQSDLRRAWTVAKREGRGKQDHTQERTESKCVPHRITFFSSTSSTT